MEGAAWIRSSAWTGAVGSQASLRRERGAKAEMGSGEKEWGYGGCRWVVRANGRKGNGVMGEYMGMVI